MPPIAPIITTDAYSSLVPEFALPYDSYKKFINVYVTAKELRELNLQLYTYPQRTQIVTYLYTMGMMMSMYTPTKPQRSS